MVNATIPLGYKYTFDPADSEVLVYLARKANGEPLPCEGVTREVDLYRLADPEKLFEGTKEKVVFVFTKLKKVSENGKRVDRSVLGNRTWKGVDGAQPIYDAKGCKVGEKKNFNLVNKMKMKVGYNMKEFSLDKDVLRSSRFKDYVICQIKKKDKKRRSPIDDNFPEEEKSNNTSVSIPAIEGNVKVHSVDFSCSHEEQMHDSYQFSKSQETTTNLVPTVYWDYVKDEELMSSGIFDPSADECQEINSWLRDDKVEAFAQNQKEKPQESNEVAVLDMNVKVHSIFGAESDLPLLPPSVIASTGA